jgi:hypothetical protein
MVFGFNIFPVKILKAEKNKKQIQDIIHIA